MLLTCHFEVGFFTMIIYKSPVRQKRTRHYWYVQNDLLINPADGVQEKVQLGRLVICMRSVFHEKTSNYVTEGFYASSDEQRLRGMTSIVLSSLWRRWS